MGSRERQKRRWIEITGADERLRRDVICGDRLGEALDLWGGESGASALWRGEGKWD